MRPRGNIIAGQLPPLTSTSVSGFFTLREAQELRAANTWPRGPVAPTGLIATAGNAQISLSWTAPATTHGTITNYLVEYTASGGSAQYVLTNSTSTSYTLTGLTNGTSYTVRVAAVNFTAGEFTAPETITVQQTSLTTTYPSFVGTGSTADKLRRDGRFRLEGAGMYVSVLQNGTFNWTSESFATNDGEYLQINGQEYGVPWAPPDRQVTFTDFGAGANPRYLFSLTRSVTAGQTLQINVELNRLVELTNNKMWVA